MILYYCVINPDTLTLQITETKMSFLNNGEYRMAGHIHFYSDIPEELLMNLPQGIKTLAPESSWVDLHIREAGDDGTYYLHLCRRLEDGGKDTQRRAVFKIIQYLRERLGVADNESNNPKFISHRGWTFSTVLAIA